MRRKARDVDGSLQASWQEAAAGSRYTQQRAGAAVGNRQDAETGQEEAQAQLEEKQDAALRVKEDAREIP